jgi:putative transposase
MSHSERRALVEHDRDALPLNTQAELLSISRRSLYYQPVPPPPEEVAIKHRIDEIYTAHPFYGSRKLTVLLEPEVGPINRKRVQRYMREMGIAGIAPGPNLSRRAMEHRIYPYLLRGVTAQAPDHIWGCDITYIRLRHGWLYLVAILDWFSRYVVSWALDDTLEVPFVLGAVEQALDTATPQIWNTDQGSQFTSPQLTTQIEAAGARISMDGKGRALDNIFTERLWRSVKYEEVYLADYGSPRAAHRGLDRYLRFYNTERPHQALDYCRPADLYHR